MAIYKRGKVYWSNIRIPGHPDADSQGRVRIPLDTDKSIAREKEAKLVLQKADHAYGAAPRGMSWEDWKKIYRDYGKKKLPHETYMRVHASLKLVDRLLPIQRLEQMTPKLLELLTAEMRAEGYEPAGINRVIGSLRTMLATAVKWEHLAKMPWDEVTRERLPKRTPKYYTEGEIAVLIGVCKEDWELATTMLGYYFGLRPGEIYAAGPEDVEIGRARYRVQPKPGFMPKDWEERTIGIHPDMAVYLARLLRELPPACRYLLGPGRPTKASFPVLYKRVLKRAGLEGSMRRLRHSFAAHLALKDVNMRKIQKLMGHKSLSSTEVYTELYSKDAEGAVALLPSVVARNVAGHRGLQ